MMRLDKMLAHAGYGSRKEVKEYIRKGLVMVNGEVVVNDDFKVDEINDEVIIADNNVSYEKMIYLLLNKPDGYVSATFDNYDPTVLDLIDGYEKRNIFPVGRLDKDTVGLLLITNDGEMAHRLLSPKKHVEKKYYLKYTGNLPKNAVYLFEEGIILEDGYKCLPAKIIDLGNNEAHIIIKEGKFHQIKRMMNVIGCEVTYLQRIEFGPIKLDSSLEEGEYRPLTKDEVMQIKEI